MHKTDKELRSQMYKELLWYSSYIFKKYMHIYISSDMLTSVKNNNTMEKQAKNNEHVFYRGRKPNNKHSKMLYSFVIKKC